MTDTDFVSIYPDPDDASFNEARDLLEGVTVESLRNIRKTLLPEPSRPQLIDPRGKRPFITVVSHEPDAFAAESEKYLGAPQALVLRYMSPTLQVAFRGLMQLTDADRARGLTIAPCSGHYVNKDAPGCVADEIWKLVYEALAEIAG
ncbi:hypothetical protein PRZ48_007184 [Zasmidium cellare]|uniref:Uncharacterized protein n=1 Tax=Zasmidium cellare TaxID=395010 RepID=A0ABR0EIM3_ZASCE|nr:hypothetical protein PRZ48_007184 [Zasmidium cellare]